MNISKYVCVAARPDEFGPLILPALRVRVHAFPHVITRAE